MGDDPTAVALVTRAAGGDPTAWDEIVERHAPLVWSICAQLSNDDREDVGQKVRLLLVEQIGKLREPAALPGWIAATTHRECLRVARAARKSELLGTELENALQFVDKPIIDVEIHMAELDAALRAAFAEHPPERRRLLTILTSDSPCSYVEISEKPQIPMGSIGPQRARRLERLRKYSALSGLGEAYLHWAGGEHCA